MTTYSVSNDAQLATAIAKAKGGDSILLAGGTYTKLNVLNMNFASNVTIASADSAHPAVVKSMLIRGSSNISLSGLDLPASEAQGNYVFQVNSSSNISLDHLNVHGTEGKISNVSPFILRGSTNVTVTNSEFSYVQHGISQLDNNGLTLTGNSFHDIRTDGIRGGGSSNVLISNNFFTDFYPAPGDHPDAIQFWTTNTTAAASNITVSNNTFVRGNGEEAQGVFMRDEVGTLHYQNVTITGNTIIGGMENGVAVGGVDGAVVRDNNVIALTGERSTIRVQDATNVVVSNNHATNYVYINADTVVRDGNILVDSFSKSTESTVLSWAKSLASASLIAKGITGMISGLDHEIGYFDSPLHAASARSFAEIVVSGTSSADKLYASTIGASRVEGGAGNDVLTGNGLFEHNLVGGAGDDSYYVKGASDHVIEAPGGGNDTVISSISYTLGDNVENLRMAVGGLTGTGNELDNRITGSSGDDTLYGMGGNDTITGGDGNDKIYGGAGNDDLRGENGNDYLDGGDGNDILSGGAGNDVLIGGAGNDVLEGGTGSDTMTGGAGNDIFRFRQADIGNGDVDKITDFTRGQDKIDLGAIDAKAGTSANDAFTFIGTNAFHNVAGELRYSVVNGDAVIQGDVNGDGKADFTIIAQHVTVLAATDFTL